MSFILDALKKLEQKRQRGSVPDLLTIHELPPQELKKRSLWPYLLLIVLLLNAGILAVWLRPWESKKPSIIAPTVEQHVIKSDLEDSDVYLSTPAPSPKMEMSSFPEVKATGEESLPKPEPTVVTPAEKPVNVVPQYQPAQAESGEEKTVSSETASTIDTKASLETSPTKPEQPLVIKGSPAESPFSANIGVASEDGVLELHELPSSVRQNMPDISISGHVYSDNPTLRIVNINGQVLREGEAVTDGLKLEEITSTGVIFSYQGFRFRIRGF